MKLETREAGRLIFNAVSVLVTQVKDGLAVLLSGSRQLSEGEAMSKEKKSAAENLADEAKRRALNPRRLGRRYRTAEPNPSSKKTTSSRPSGA